MRARAFLLLAPLLTAAAGACAANHVRRVRVADDLELYVRTKGSGPTTIVVPGASWMEHDLGPLLAEHRVVFYDPRGRGRSSPVGDAELSLQRDVADLEELRAALGLERMSLLGWAYYGGVALRYAIALPGRVERLVLIAPMPPRRSPFWNQLTARIGERTDAETLTKIVAMRRTGSHRRDPYGYCRMVTEAIFRIYCHDPESVARIHSNPCVLPNLDPDVTARQGKRIVDGLGDWDWTAELGALSVPTLLVHGREDPLPLGSSEEYATRLPRAQLLALDDTGHLPWVECPERFFPPVLDFLAGRASPAD